MRPRSLVYIVKARVWNMGSKQVGKEGSQREGCGCCIHGVLVPFDCIETYFSLSLSLLLYFFVFFSPFLSSISGGSGII